MSPGRFYYLGYSNFFVFFFFKRGKKNYFPPIYVVHNIYEENIKFFFLTFFFFSLSVFAWCVIFFFKFTIHVAPWRFPFLATWAYEPRQEKRKRKYICREDTAHRARCAVSDKKRMKTLSEQISAVAKDASMYKGWWRPLAGSSSATINLTSPVDNDCLQIFAQSANGHSLNYAWSSLTLLSLYWLTH